VRQAMSADKSRPSHHRGQDAATSAVAPVCVPGATGQFPGVRARIDAGRAYLVMSPAGSADRQPRSLGRAARQRMGTR
jgi:hypothetical protein